MKKFKSKKHIKIKYKKILITIITIILSILILKKVGTLKIIKLKPVKTLEYSNIYKTSNIKKDIQKSLFEILRIDINKPTTILNKMIPYQTPNKKLEDYKIIKNEIKSSEPLVYIYNTHQSEEYIGNELTPNPTVLTASYYLKDNLEKLGIKTIVEETNISEILDNNNWNYNQSYKASRINLEKIKEEYPSIKIFIDLHRDAVPRNLSTVTIDNKEYAKVLFVIGKEHDNYLKNLEFTQSLNNIIEKNYPELTKGILQKEGPGVNGIYNQDLKENIILMEVGAQDNTIEEVTNTLDIMSNIIKEKINEKET
jgi:stage II sporulation protein P